MISFDCPKCKVEVQSRIDNILEKTLTNFITTSTCPECKNQFKVSIYVTEFLKN